MQHTRQQIIDYLQINRMGTPKEMSHVLLVTTANIRYHLRILKDAGLVEEIGNTAVRGRGRPTKIFSLTENALKNNLEGLVDSLLKTVLSNKAKVNAILTDSAGHLLGEYQPVENMHTQLHRAVEKLNQLKYQASWEASPSGPRIIIRNCPYAPVISDHPELCELDAALLTKMLNQPVQQSAKLKRSPDGSPHCSFLTTMNDRSNVGLSKDSV